MIYSMHQKQYMICGFDIYLPSIIVCLWAGIELIKPYNSTLLQGSPNRNRWANFVKILSKVKNSTWRILGFRMCAVIARVCFNRFSKCSVWLVYTYIYVYMNILYIYIFTYMNGWVFWVKLTVTMVGWFIYHNFPKCSMYELFAYGLWNMKTHSRVKCRQIFATWSIWVLFLKTPYTESKTVHTPYHI